jgi:hypothetical protein
MSAAALALPCPPSFTEAVGPARPWSYTASSPPRDAQDLLVVCHVPLGTLGIDDLVDEVVDRCGDGEARTWQHARAEEYGKSLLSALRMHISNAELMVHLDEEPGPGRVQVMVTPTGDPAEAARREVEVLDRVEAIRKRAWLTWWQSLRDTVNGLRALENAY